jgi:hypothetical protein
MEFKPERIQKCSSISVNGTVEKIFPLFGPIREKEWAEGWDPEILYSTTNIAEAHMMFRTKSHYRQEEFYYWVITQFDPMLFKIEYTVSTPNRIWFITISCEPDGAITRARICYTFTGLNETGNQLNRDALEKMFADNLRDWEEAINYYLKHGKIQTQH